MAEPNCLEIRQQGEQVATLTHLGFCRVLVSAARDIDLHRDRCITHTPFGVIFHTNLVVSVRDGFTVLVSSTPTSFVQVNTNVVWGREVDLLLNMSIDYTRPNRVYARQPLAVLCLLESEERPSLPILGPVISLDEAAEEEEAEAAGSASPGSQAPPPSPLVPETPPPDSNASRPGSAITYTVPSSDAEEQAAAAEASEATEAFEVDEAGSDSLWSSSEEAEGDSSDDAEDDDAVTVTEGSGSDRDSDDENLFANGGDPLETTRGVDQVRHPCFILKYNLSARAGADRFPPRRGYVIRKMLSETELQLSDDAATMAWQASVDCSSCPYDCIFFNSEWERAGDEVEVTIVVASHMFSQMRVEDVSEMVRLTLEHRARVFFRCQVDVMVRSMK